jgi:CheY-like chemotaxis protein
MKKFNVLIVEEDAGEQIIFRNAIEKFAENFETELLYATHQLSDFFLKDSVLRQLNRQKIPDLVFVTAKERSVDLEAVRRIKYREEYKSLPVYYFTKTTHTEDELRAINCGVTALITQPSTCLELNAIIENILSAVVLYQQPA